MLPYAPAALRPPVASRELGRRYGLQRRSPLLGQTFDDMFGWPPWAGDIVRLGFHSLTAALGIHVGLTSTGFWKWFGWVLAVGQAVGAVTDVVSIAKRITGTHPAEGGGA